MSDFTKLNRFERVAKLNGASAKARAVWARAHNALDRRGRMELGGAEWQSVMCRRLRIETSERQWFHAGLRELEQRGLISVVDDVFTLLGHADSDKHLRPTFPGPPSNLLPTSPVPTSDLPSTCSGPSPDLPPTFPRPVPDLPLGTPENHSESAPRARVQNREEEKREEVEESRSEGAEAPPLSTPGLELFRDYCSALQTRACRFETLTDEKRKLADRAATELTETAKLRSTTVATLLSKALDAWFADTWAKSKGFQFAMFAKQASALAIGEAPVANARASPRRGPVAPTPHATFANLTEADDGF